MSSISGLCSLGLSQYLFAFVLATTLHPRFAAAHDNGMDMGMDMGMQLAGGNELNYLHFSPLGDVLWFQGWVPRSAGAMFGTCVGLCLLGMLERWLACCRGLMDAHWRKQTPIIRARRRVVNHANRRGVSAESGIRTLTTRTRAVASSSLADRLRSFALQLPFIFSFDVARALIQAAQSAMEFTFMLAVMTYQASFIISIVIGQGVGEMLFGRFNEAAHLR